MREVPFLDACDIQGGTQPPKSTFKQEPSETYIRLLQIRDFKSDDNQVYVPRACNLKTCDESDIMIARYGASIGRILQGKSGAYNVALVKTIPNDDLIHRPYLSHYLRSPRFQNYILGLGGRAAQAGFNKKDLERTTIPIPPLDEQKRIAAILDQADALRHLRQRAIDRLNTLGQAIFHEMFGDLIANERGFDFVAVGDVIDGFETGKNLAEDPDAKRADGYRVLKISAVTSGTFKPEESKPLPLEYDPPESHIVRDGDLLFSRANTAQLIGATAFARTDDSNLVLPDKLWRFVWKANSLVLPEFVKELFSSSPFRYEIGKRSSGTSGSMKNIGKQKVMTIEFGLPRMDLQKEFSRKLAATNKQAEANRKLLQTSDDLFGSLQIRAFRGEL